MGTAKKRGPKPKPKSQRQSERVEVKFTSAELARITKAAAIDEASYLATWIHDLAIARAKELLD